MRTDHQPPHRSAPAALVATAALLVALLAAGCGQSEARSLRTAATVTVLPAPGAPAKPVAAGPVITSVTAVPAPTTSMPGSVPYVVQAGDTLHGIAGLFNTTFAVLLQLNPLKDPAKLGVGQTLVVPGPPPATDGSAPPAEQPAAGLGPSENNNPEGPGSAASNGATASTEAPTTLPAATKEG